jgi:hypothetical protein
MRDFIEIEQSREHVTARMLIFLAVFSGLLTAGLMALPA